MEPCPSLQPLLLALGLPACRNLAGVVVQFLSAEDLDAMS
jgi:hypothetical protein